MGATSEKCNAVDHHTHNLNQFGDSLYFTSAYKQKLVVTTQMTRNKKNMYPFSARNVKNILLISS